MTDTSAISRRRFLQFGACAGFLGTTLGMPELSYATVPGNKVFVFVMLNGGADGLDHVCPFGDSTYRNLRPTLRREAPGVNADSVLDINHNYYGLSPNLGSIHNLYMGGKLGFFHSVAFSDSQMHGGSHFTATSDMVRGGMTVNNLPLGINNQSGWVNRLMQVLGGATGMSMAESNQIMPFLNGVGNVLNYQAPGGMANTSLVDMMQQLYSPLSHLSDLLGEGYREAMQLNSSLAGHENLTNAPRINDMCHAIRERMALAAYMALAGVANVFVLRQDGHDTHSNGVVSQFVRAFSDGMAAFHTIMNDAGRGGDYLVAAGSEFGRAIDQTEGTQHGDGGLMTIMSGNTALMQGIGGNVLPGQLNLNQRSINNSLRPVVYAYDVLRTMLRAFYGLTQEEAMQVFPNRTISNVMGGSGA